MNSINFVKGDFEHELGDLRMCMITKMLVVLVPFMSFAYIYNVNKTHNMLVLMLTCVLNPLIW
jgi:hypothetical protein